MSETISDVEMGMVLQAMGRVELLARELCRLAFTEKPELREHTLPLEQAIRELDDIPAIKRTRIALSSSPT